MNYLLEIITDDPLDSHMETTMISKRTHLIVRKGSYYSIMLTNNTSEFRRCYVEEFFKPKMVVVVPPYKKVTIADIDGERLVFSGDRSQILFSAFFLPIDAEDEISSNLNLEDNIDNSIAYSIAYYSKFHSGISVIIVDKYTHPKEILSTEMINSLIGTLSFLNKKYNS